MDDQPFAQMISKMAHELRSPLTSVKGFSSMLTKNWDRFSDEQRQEFIAAIHSDAERMARIISEVLDLARAEAGVLELDRSEVALHEIVADALEGLASEEGSERLQVDVSDELRVDVDGARIQTVIHNLVENALRFSEEGPIEVIGQERGGSVILTVRDEGDGIPQDRIGDLFKGAGPKGQRATPRGTGFGLYLARLVLEAHGGSITVESVEGQGSTFSLELPRGKR